MRVFQKKFERIRNLPVWQPARDFRYGKFSFLLLMMFAGAGIGLELGLGGMPPLHLLFAATGALCAAVAFAAAPSWPTVIALELLLWVGFAAWPAFSSLPLAGLLSAGFLLSPALQLVEHWDKAVILRAGRFHAVRGPGLFLLFPVLDSAKQFVDTRIRATDFTAEKTLTRDTVPVHVDALAFWMIWDTQKAILEVESYLDAVTLSAQAALRDSIGRYDLTTLLTQRDTLCREIQTILDAKTNPWGITILSVEFTDIIIPPGLEDAMSRVAQAEREKQARVILGSAEVEIAARFQEAAEKYRNDPTALNLRAMNMVYESIRNRGAMVLVPSGALESMNLGAVMGAAAAGAGLRTEQGAATNDKESEEAKG